MKEALKILMRNLVITKSISSNGLEKRRQPVQLISHVPNGNELLW